MRYTSCIVFKQNFQSGTLPALYAASPHRGVQKGVQKMTYSSIDPRQLVISLTGALFTSLMFVSAATSLPLA
jgi:hypothetical protein